MPDPTPTDPAPQSDPEALLNAAAEAVASLGDLAASTGESRQEPRAEPVGPAPAPIKLPTFGESRNPAETRAIDLLADVNLNVKIELGRTRMIVEDVLKLGEGAVVELDKLAGDPVDVYVNDRHVARGEVLVLNDNFCVRVNEILTPSLDGAGPSAAAA